MVENEDNSTKSAMETAPRNPTNKRSPGRPAWKTSEGKMVSRQIYMTEAEWALCRKYGNASAFLRTLVEQYASQQGGPTPQMSHVK